MLSLTVTDLKKMTTLLFVKEAFDKFMVHDATFKTAMDVSFAGEKNPAFFEESEQQEALKVPCVLWEELRPIVFSVIKGKRLPLSFKVVLLTTPEMTETIRKRAGFTDCPVSSLSINLSYHDNQLFLTTGIAYKGFSMDKSLEKAWDGMVGKFLEEKEVTYEAG